MLVLAAMVHRRCTVELSEEGVILTMFGPRSIVIPWTDTERVQNPPLSLRLVRRGTKKRQFVQFLFLCPNPLQQPVGRAIRAHLATAQHENTNSVLSSHRSSDQGQPPAVVHYVEVPPLAATLPSGFAGLRRRCMK